MRWRKLLILVFPIIVGLVLFTKPIKVDCITAEYTYCPPEVESVIGQLSSKRFLFASRHYEDIKMQAMGAEPTLSKLTFQQTPWWTIKAIAQISPVAVTITANGEHFDLRANGLLTASEIEPIVPFIFEDPSLWLSEDQSQIVNLDESTIDNLSTLYEQFSQFNPRLVKIVLYSPEEIKIFLEGHGPVLVRADDKSWLDPQLAALQAFFRTSTIASDYQELDARFADLVVR